MFAPNQERAAAEMARVCKAGGKIGLANWTPSGFVGQMFRIIGKYFPPPDGLKPPSLWGTEARLHELFPGVAKIETTTRQFRFRALTVEHWLQGFSKYYGPMNKAMAALDDAGKAGLTADILAMAASLNEAEDGTMVAPSEYLEIVMTK
jgi:hypothetical protein